jgi:hypothetical protein
MARNFKISVRRNSGDLHLKLVGDFDGISAYELLSVLKRNCNPNSRVFIHTSALREVHPFGVNVFHKDLSVLKGKSVQLIFAGENANKIEPESFTL